MGKSRPPKVHRYSMHFKATAVRLSSLPDVLIQDVAKAINLLIQQCHSRSPAIPL